MWNKFHISFTMDISGYLFIRVYEVIDDDVKAEINTEDMFNRRNPLVFIIEIYRWCKTMLLISDEIKKEENRTLSSILGSVDDVKKVGDYIRYSGELTNIMGNNPDFDANSPCAFKREPILNVVNAYIGVAGMYALYVSGEVCHENIDKIVNKMGIRCEGKSGMHPPERLERILHTSITWLMHVTRQIIVYQGMKIDTDIRQCMSRHSIEKYTPPEFIKKTKRKRE